MRVRLTCQYLRSLDYVQDHTFTDVHLVLGYLAVIFVAAAAAYEYKIGFKDAKGVSTLSVGSYFILQGALYCWTNYIVRDTVYVGKKGDIIVSSLVPFYIPRIPLLTSQILSLSTTCFRLTCAD